VFDVSGVTRGRRLEDQDFCFLIGRRTVFDAVRHNDELAGTNLKGLIAKFDAEPATDSEKELILRLVVVPDERPLELDQLHLLAVQFAHHAVPSVSLGKGNCLLCAADMQSDAPVTES
jgi:hypothetical protein